MTDLVPHTGTPGGEVSRHAAASLTEWAQAAAAAHSLASALVKTTFVPPRYRGKAEEATVAILAGAEVGLSPLASLAAFDDIQGTAAPKARTLVAIVQAHGHHVDIIEEDDEHAVARYRRKGDPEWRTVTYTTADAARAGLPGRNPNWKTQPRNMCVARVQAMAARRVAADALLGIPYSAEELRDGTGVAEHAGPPVEAPRPRVTAEEIRRPRAKKPPASEAPPAEVPAEDPPPAADDWPTPAPIPTDNDDRGDQ